MKKLLGLLNQFTKLLVVLGALLVAGLSIKVNAQFIKRCALQIPLSGSHKAISDKESKVIKKNLRQVTALVEEARKNLDISTDYVTWNVPYDVLKKSKIQLPTYINDKGFKVNSPERMIRISMRDMGDVVEDYCDEIVENLDTVCLKGTFCDLHHSMIPVSTDKVAFFYEKSPYKNDDTVVVAIKIESSALCQVASIIDREIVQHRGLARSEKQFIPHITIAQIDNLSHVKAQKLLDNLNEAKHQISLNGAPVRLKKLTVEYGSITVGAWNLQNFTHV